MSLISMLGLLLVPLKAKPPSKLADEVERANFALNHWRNAWHVLWAENERLREQVRNLEAERDRLRKASESLHRRLSELAVLTDPTSPYYRHRGFAAEQARQQQQSLQSFQGLGQVAQQVARNALGQQMAQNNAMPQLNQQSNYVAAMQAYAGCTCVPSRGEALNRP